MKGLSILNPRDNLDVDGKKEREKKKRNLKRSSCGYKKERRKKRKSKNPIEKQFTAKVRKDAFKRMSKNVMGRRKTREL